MNPIYKEIIGTWVRAALHFLSAFLIQHRIVTAAQGEAVASMLFDQILNSLPALGSLAWSWWQKRTSRQKLDIALKLPAGATEADVKAVQQAAKAKEPSIAGPLLWLLCGFLSFGLLGCGSTPVQVKSGSDPIVVHAEWLAENGANTLNQFLAFERANEGALRGKFPEAHGMADLIREDVVEIKPGQFVPASILKLRTITKQYQADKTAANGDKVKAASKALLDLVNDVRGYMGQPPLTFPAARTPSVRDLMTNAPTNGPNQ